MNSDAKHTPTPWKLVTGMEWDIANEQGGAIVSTIRSADAEFIVHAVNSHESNEKKIAALLEAARIAINCISPAYHGYAIAKLKEAIAKADPAKTGTDDFLSRAERESNIL